MSTPSNESILDILDSDMQGITELTSKLAATADTFDEQVETVRLVREIVENQVACEQFLHPLIRRDLPDGEQVAHQQFQQHRALESLLRRLEDLKPHTPEFQSALAEVHENWVANSKYLAEEVFPSIKVHTDSAELKALADQVLGAESSGPTRPRLLAVEQPVANALLSITQGFVDKSIDAFSHRGHEDSKELDQRVQEGRYDDLES